MKDGAGGAAIGAADIEIARIETEAFLAWPAAEVESLGEWRLRATPGVGRRANSVWIGGGGGASGSAVAAASFEERVAGVEAFYAARGQPAMFQLTPAPESAALDAFLAGRGYVEESTVGVQVARAEAVARAGGEPDDARVEVSTSLPDAWFEISAHQGRYREVAPAYRALLQRLSGRASFALAHCEGVPAAVGLLVKGHFASGVFAMQTLPPFRKRALGAAILHALADRPPDTLLYLQVEHGNLAAERLYTTSGFRERYRYHYRVKR